MAERNAFAGAPSPRPEQGAADGIAGRKQVYIIDDDPVTRRSISFALKAAGFDVCPFICGRDFLDEVDGLASGTVLLDLRMPVMDGIAVLDALGERVRRFPVVVITGHGDVEVAVKAMKSGATDFLEKPFTDATLLAVLEMLFLALPAQAEADAERVQAKARVASLTPREQEVMQALAAGLANKEIAHRLSLSIRTVEMHRSSLMTRLRVKSLAEVVRVAILAGVKPSK